MMDFSEPILEGYLQFQSGKVKKSYKRMFCKLYRDRLLVYDTLSADPTKSIPLDESECVAAHPEAKPNITDPSKNRKFLKLRLTSRKTDYFFLAESIDQRNEWIITIRNRNNIRISYRQRKLLEEEEKKKLAEKQKKDKEDEEKRLKIVQKQKLDRQNTLELASENRERIGGMMQQRLQSQLQLQLQQRLQEERLKQEYSEYESDKDSQDNEYFDETASATYELDLLEEKIENIRANEERKKLNRSDGLSSAQPSRSSSRTNLREITTEESGPEDSEDMTTDGEKSNNLEDEVDNLSTSSRRRQDRSEGKISKNSSLRSSREHTEPESKASSRSSSRRGTISGASSEPDTAASSVPLRGSQYLEVPSAKAARNPDKKRSNSSPSTPTHKDRPPKPILSPRLARMDRKPIDEADLSTELMENEKQVEVEPTVASLPPSPRLRDRSSSVLLERKDSAPPSPIVSRSRSNSQSNVAPTTPIVQQEPVIELKEDTERKRKVVDFSPMVRLSVALPVESDEEDNEDQEQGEAPIVLTSSIPEGMPVPLGTLKSLANHSLDPGRNRVIKTLEGRVTFNSDEDEWNEKYQKLVDSETMTFEQSLVQGMGISALLGAFIAASKKYARLIIDEYHIPDTQKTIPPVPMGPDVPESERDEIYIQSGILFRFAVDPTGNLDEETSYIIANHELKGAKAYIETNTQGIHITLSSIIDYKGFRMLSVAFFPADGENTLYYALSTTVLRMDETVKKLLQMARPKLNLKEHLICPRGSASVAIQTSSFLAVHKCDDKRYYFINLSRVFPPDLPTPHTNEKFTKQLRPELVKSYRTPLSSDAFAELTPMPSDYEVNNIEAASASQYLYKVVIPNFVKELDMLDVILVDSQCVTSEMHSRGINIRYLGVVAELTKLPHVRDTMVVEMVARASKGILGSTWRKVARQCREQPPSSLTELPADAMKAILKQELETVALDFFNLALGTTKQSIQFWDTVILRVVFDKFKYRIQFNSIHKGALFLALQYHCGVKFRDEDKYDFTGEFHPLTVDDLKSIQVNSKFVENEASDCWIIANKYKEYMNEGSFEKALQALHLKLSIHKLLHGLYNLEASSLLSYIAHVSNKLGNIDYAILCGLAALGVSQNFHAAAARTYLALMESFFIKGKEAEALTCYNHAVRVIKFHHGALHPMLLDAHSCVAKLYASSQKYQQAQEYYQKALTLSSKILGNNHPHTAMYCNKVGNIYRNMLDYEHALSLYEKALLIYNTVLGPTTLTVAQSYYLIAGILAAKGDFDKALEYAVKSQVTRERLLGQKHPLTLGSYYQVAYIADRMDNYQVAIPFFEKLLTQLKLVRDEAVIQDIQNITKAIIKLKFRNLVPQQKLLLDKVRAQNNLNPSRHLFVIETVIAKLHQYSPSEYLDELLFNAGIAQEAFAELSCIEQLVHDRDMVVISPEIPQSSYLVVNEV